MCLSRQKCPECSEPEHGAAPRHAFWPVLAGQVFALVDAVSAFVHALNDAAHEPDHARVRNVRPEVSGNQMGRSGLPKCL